MPRKIDRYADLKEFCEATGIKKGWIAKQLGVTPPQFSELLNPDIYHPKVDDELVAKIAELLNQTDTYVRRMYPRAA
jgi:hypothetical protein